MHWYLVQCPILLSFFIDWCCNLYLDLVYHLCNAVDRLLIIIVFVYFLSKGWVFLCRDEFVDFWVKRNMMSKNIESQIYNILKQPGFDYLIQVSLLFSSCDSSKHFFIFIIFLFFYFSLFIFLILVINNNLGWF